MVNANRVMITELSVIRERLDSVIDNQNEFKTLLRRTAPYERRE